VIIAEPVAVAPIWSRRSCDRWVKSYETTIRRGSLWRDHQPKPRSEDSTERSRAGFSPKAAYIFRKQIKRADFVVINRIDEMWRTP